MKEAAVIGMPISHSRSPAIFGFLAKTLNVADLNYHAIPVESSALSEFLAKVRKQPDWIGMNVTIPHKEAIRRELDSVSLEASAVGAVNVVEVRGGKFLGHNTDVFGVIRALEEHRCAVHGQSVWLWGAGGAARAVAYALGKMGASQVVIANRTLARAEKIADEIGSLFPATQFQAVAMDGEIPALASSLKLVVNCTPVGMHGFSGDSDLFGALSELPFRSDAFAFDLIYDPAVTPFLSLARSLGLKTIGGLDMLIYQALATWEIWFSSKLAGDEAARLKESLAAYLGELIKIQIKDPRPIFLTGFMGVGKSTIGSALAKELGWGFIDTDKIVTKTAGISIPEIFSERGEAGFRSLEAAAVEAACAMPRTVVALGGGAVLDPVSLKKIQSAGDLVFLSAGLESLQGRLAKSGLSRPLLAGLDAHAQKERIQSLLAVRAPIYESARHRIETDGLAPDEVARRIVASVRKERA